MATMQDPATLTELRVTDPCPFKSIDHFHSVWAQAHPSEQLSEARRQAEDFKREFKAAGLVDAVRTCNLVQFPYPMKYGLRDAAPAIYPFLMMRHRMNVVQYFDHDNVRRTLLFNPSEYDLGREAPFFKNLAEKYGSFLSDRVFSTKYGKPLTHVSKLGIDPASVDYVSFDHWHVQDLRPLLGTHDGRFKPLFPNARIIVQRAEVETLLQLHPMQAPWYVHDGLSNADLSKLIIVDGDVVLGTGVALIATPGHTRGNHSLVLNTPEGVFTISENGVSPDAYRPEASTMPGMRSHIKNSGHEVVLNGNTVELIMQQYTSMVIEKTLADESPSNRNFLNTWQSSPFVPSWITPGYNPTFVHHDLHVGDIR